MDEPMETGCGIVKQVFLPAVNNSFFRHAANEKTDDGQGHPINLAGRAQWNQRLNAALVERREIPQVSLTDVEQRLAIRAGDALRLVGSMQFQRTAAFRAVQL